MKIEAQVELASRSTLGVGGCAAHYARVTSDAELGQALDFAQQQKLPVRVLGGGSNIVVADAGFDGLVIDMATRGIFAHPDGPAVDVRVHAGEPWDEFVEAMVSEGYQGLECLSGIPGRVGATPIQNVGAYGQEVSETITRVVALDCVDRKRLTFSTDECRFTYRDSVFKSVEPGRFIVTEVTFRLSVGGTPALRYAELERWFADRGVQTPSLSAVRDAVIDLRRAKSMLVDPSDPDCRSCGSFFVNPILSKDEFARFSQLAQNEGDVPTFPQENGRVKLSAGWLIEHAGFPRGTRDGRVGLSSKHALALVAHEGARAQDIVIFARRVQAGVLGRFGIRLESEPVFWGFPGASLRLPSADPTPTRRISGISS